MPAKLGYVNMTSSLILDTSFIERIIDTDRIYTGLSSLEQMEHVNHSSSHP